MYLSTIIIQQMNSSLTMSIKVKDFITALDAKGMHYKVTAFKNVNKYPKGGIEIRVDYDGLLFFYWARAKGGEIDVEKVLHFGRLETAKGDVHKDHAAYMEQRELLKHIGLK